MEQPGSIGRDEIGVFCQGPIARVGELLPFKREGFVSAIHAGVPVVPVTIHHCGDVLPSGRRLARKPGNVTVECSTPLPPQRSA